MMGRIRVLKLSVAVVPAIAFLSVVQAASAVTIFDNQFNGTWTGSDPVVSGVSQYNPPPNVGGTFTNDGDTSGTTWTTSATSVYPWDNGGVFFFAAGDTGTIDATVASTVNAQVYTVDWGVILIGPDVGLSLTATADAGSQTLGGTTTGTFDFTGTGGDVTLSIASDLPPGVHGSSDVILDYVTVTTVPEPGTLLLLLTTGIGLVSTRRRRVR